MYNNHCISSTCVLCHNNSIDLESIKKSANVHISYFITPGHFTSVESTNACGHPHSFLLQLLLVVHKDHIYRENKLCQLVYIMQCHTILIRIPLCCNTNTNDALIQNIDFQHDAKYSNIFNKLILLY